ncbi:biopolymer transporter ExbD [Corallococcus sp. AB049A]|uniref:Biopolymer transporter ExbD n=1 Tax=Corallococcus interemptor TaxID=2316720 RepID=A0A3A8QHF9_9BACT|nr:MULTISPECIES: biopolymer transporter ExbD [Corallococcus]RKH52433.1 biopolymer transporter ExbD [Corallococcus sp. AB050B]RKH68159.1 biopolymer transporter ExbD [Corallococcus interemptor]RKI67709.1 biopolymer transporter ExbD [Corallococcus sp. AB049A]
MHARRSAIVKPQSGLQADINVTPLVDVVLVLLIIFMVMTPLLRGELQLQLPPMQTASAEDAPTSRELAPGLVRLTADGTLLLEGEPVSEAEFVPRLRTFLEARPKGQRGLFFQPDARAPYTRLISALDGAKAAGAEALALSVQNP